MINNFDIQKISEELKKLNYNFQVISEIKSGKEATVYKVFLNDEVVAMKVYKDPNERSFKNTNQYLLGKHFKKLSEKKAFLKGNKFAKKSKHSNWIKREFFALEKLYDLKAKIPKPILQIENTIFMEFLGNLEINAPRLCDIDFDEKEAIKNFKKILETIQIFWDFGIVHADLSEYNILWWNNEPYIIDFPQSIDKRNNPNAEEVLNRDLNNITKFFNKFIENDDLEKIKINYLFN